MLDFGCVIRKCRIDKSLTPAPYLYSFICSIGLESHSLFGNYVLSLLVKIGSVFNARQVFDKLVHRDDVSWNTLIIGYAKQKELTQATIVLQKMHEDGFYSLHNHTFVEVLKACSLLRDIDTGQQLHSMIDSQDLESDVFIGSNLINMYVKCNFLSKARTVLDNLLVRNTVSWNALIVGYAEHAQGKEAFDCLEDMKKDGLSPDSVTFSSCLKACGIIGSLEKGLRIHTEIIIRGVEVEAEQLTSNSLISMYAKCGALREAKNVLSSISLQSVVSWTALISGYLENGHAEQALNFYEEMRLKGVIADAFTVASVLKAYGNIGSAIKGYTMHSEIIAKGFLENDAFVGTALVYLYAMCGLFVDAEDVFEKLKPRVVVSWNALITGYVEHGHYEEALYCFDCMQQEGTLPDITTFVCILKACGSTRVFLHGQEIHFELTQKALLGTCDFINSSLIGMYAKCGLFEEAQDVFDKLPMKKVVSCNALISGYVEHGYDEEAVQAFELFLENGGSVDTGTVVSVLKACGNLGAVIKGQEIHACIAKRSLDYDAHVGNTLVDMYVKCRLLIDAEAVFEKLGNQDVVAWTALITGYVDYGCNEGALYLFERMQVKGIPPDAITFLCSLKAFRCLSDGQTLHADVVKKGVLEKEAMFGNALIEFYVKFGLLTEAQEVLNRLSFRSMVSWTLLISGYVQHGCGQDALFTYERMKNEGIIVDSITLICCLIACCTLCSRNKGQQIHSEIVKKGMDTDTIISNTLVDMYSKCGLLLAAQEEFDNLESQDTVSWNALIGGYAQIGQSQYAFNLFQAMIGKGTQPDEITFTSMLNTCSHAGLVDEGNKYFEEISTDVGVIPTLDHYNCMVDLLGRAGLIEEAIVTIDKMPFHPTITIWHTLLGACRKWGNIDIGRHAFMCALQLNEKDTVAYICMSNICADAAILQELLYESFLSSPNVTYMC